MKGRDVDLIVNAVKDIFDIPTDYEERLRTRLSKLELVTGSKPVKYSWIEEARIVARRIAVDNGFVTIEDVLSEFPLQDEADPRIVGGVFKHPMFVRTGNRTIQAHDGRYKTIGVFALQQSSGHQPITDWD